jgi:hypothetical protein
MCEIEVDIRTLRWQFLQHILNSLNLKVDTLLVNDSTSLSLSSFAPEGQSDVVNLLYKSRVGSQDTQAKLYPSL